MQDQNEFSEQALEATVDFVVQRLGQWSDHYQGRTHNKPHAPEYPELALADRISMECMPLLPLRTSDPLAYFGISREYVKQEINSASGFKYME